MATFENRQVCGWCNRRTYQRQGRLSAYAVTLLLGERGCHFSVWGGCSLHFCNEMLTLISMILSLPNRWESLQREATRCSKPGLDRGTTRMGGNMRTRSKLPGFLGDHGDCIMLLPSSGTLRTPSMSFRKTTMWLVFTGGGSIWKEYTILTW